MSAVNKGCFSLTEASISNPLHHLGRKTKLFVPGCSSSVIVLQAVELVFFEVGSVTYFFFSMVFRPSMKEKLRQGVTLVVDRYAFSGVAFTSAKENFCVDWCKQPDIGLPKPDLILFLQLSPEEAAARGDFGSERYENSLFQEKVLQSFYHLMKDKTLNWKMIDASKSIEDLHREIKSIAEETMLEVQNKPLGELWK
uniref:dTMP kinase n=1 Tax=Anser cygnoides TaxID=8845 RepID=A0A8B9DR49_ANSCY